MTGFDNYFGNYVIIDHHDGTYSVYAHMCKEGIKTSGTVKQGDVIGYIGNSGASAVAHLHFQVVQNPASPWNTSFNMMPANPEITISTTYNLPEGWPATKVDYIIPAANV